MDTLFEQNCWRKWHMHKQINNNNNIHQNMSFLCNIYRYHRNYNEFRTNFSREIRAYPFSNSSYIEFLIGIQFFFPIIVDSFIVAEKIDTNRINIEVLQYILLFSLESVQRTVQLIDNAPANIKCRRQLQKRNPISNIWQTTFEIEWVDKKGKIKHTYKSF